MRLYIDSLVGKLDKLESVEQLYQNEKERSRTADFELKAKMSTKVHRWVAVQLHSGNYDTEEVRKIMQEMNKLKGLIRAQEEFKLSQSRIESINRSNARLDTHHGLSKTVKR